LLAQPGGETSDLAALPEGQALAIMQAMVEKATGYFDTFVSLFERFLCVVLYRDHCPCDGIPLHLRRHFELPNTENLSNGALGNQYTLPESLLPESAW
jgi:hypothetical protein